MEVGRSRAVFQLLSYRPLRLKNDLWPKTNYFAVERWLASFKSRFRPFG